jgi:AraC family transcriptional regulator, transcriptional activator of pobA
VSEYAEFLTVSLGYLNKCVKATTGRTPHDLLDDVVLLEAKVLLKQTDLHINEIAYKIDKQDPSDFGRFFKNKTGMTPKEYKQS